MKQRLTGHVRLLCLLLPVLFSSCLKDKLKELDDLDGIAVNPYESVPLVNTHMGIRDIYNSYSEKAFIIEGSDKFLTFVYKSTDSLAPRQFVSIPTLDIDYDLHMDQGAINQFNSIGTYSNSFSNYALIQPSNKERIKKISIKRGGFIVNVNSSFKHNCTIVLTYPSITRNGRALVDTIHFVYQGSDLQVNKVIDMAGYDIDMSDGGISYNVIPYLMEITLERIPGNPVSVNDKLTISEQVNISEYNYVQGYLGKFSVLTYSTSESLDIFDKQADGNIFIKDPRIRLQIDNNIGMPITARVSNLRVLTGKGDIYPVNVNQFKDTFTFQYPSLAQRGQVIESEYVIDRTNSNLDTVLSRGPQRVVYDLDFVANYNEIVDDDNFLFDYNTFNANATIELPLEIKVVDYELRNEGDMNLQGQTDGVTVDWVKIKGYFENSFPIGSSVQLYFTRDSVIHGVDSFVVVDSLYQVPLPIPPAVIDADGKVLQTAVVTNETMMDGAKYDRLVNVAKKYLLVARAHTSDYHGVQPFVKVYSYQGMNFKIGAEAKGKYRRKL